MTHSAGSANAGTGNRERSSRRRGRTRSNERPASLGNGVGAFLWDLLSVFKSKSRHTSGSHKRIVVLLVLGGAVLRALMLDLPIIWEEAHAWKHFISQPFGYIISHHAHQGNHVLHSLLSALSTKIFGLGLVQMRLPAFLAGVLLLPLVYLFVRAQFNRYIAMMTLALVASSGPLVEYSALARGTSITWLCFAMGLLLGRHFIKTNNWLSAVLTGVVLALGMWSTPAMLHPAVTVVIWILLTLLFRHGTTLGPRLAMLGISVLTFIVFTILFYAPVVMEHGLDKILWHSAHGGDPREQLAATYRDMPMELWYYINQTGAVWVSFLGLAGLLYASFISSKYRVLLLALLLGSAPVVVLQGELGPPRVWIYTLVVLHISSAIGLFYLLKFLQENVWKKLSKRLRTAMVSFALLIAFGWTALAVLPDRLERQGAAEEVIELLEPVLQTGDRIASEPPWTSAIEFHAEVNGIDRAFLEGRPAKDAMLYIFVVPRDDHDPSSVLEHNGLRGLPMTAAEPMMERSGIRLLAARVLADR